MLLLSGNQFVLDSGEKEVASALAEGGKEESIDEAIAGEIYQYFK